MTRTTNARLAGFTFRIYIALGVAGMVLSGKATGAQGTAAKLAGIAQHATEFRFAVLLGLPTCFAALVLGITLYRITCDQDPDLALLALASRVCEGLLGAISLSATLGLLWLGTAAGANAPDAATAQTLGTFLFEMPGWTGKFGATFFAVGSTLFSYLLLRGRAVPVSLAWLGVFASVLLVVCLPLQLAGFLHGRVTSLLLIPMAAFELPLGMWLLIKGVATKATL
jgi:hypothetical protein